MFSGIVEEAARVVALVREEDNLHITLKCAFANELRIDQSVSHNGVCLTVVSLNDDATYTVTAIKETLERSNLGMLRVGDSVNVERSLKFDGRLDGHIVQGHVDQTAVCESVSEADGSWYYKFVYDVPREMARKGYFTVDKGSVTVNGVSLTVCEPDSQPDSENPDILKSSFKVAIIPYTHDNTNFKTINAGTTVNLEFDILGKYLARLAAI
ncbi:MAG: riboflavin synthase [Candidatus Amulumruptor caecigallinarius]|nr:riboflavin synthase [Candidatus Amulumruptor caecigallinarius]